MDTAAEIQASPVLEGSALVLSDFPQAQPFDLRLQAGCHLFITGARGSGKGLLLRSLVGLATLHGGKVSLFGLELSEIPRQRLLELRKRTALLKAAAGDGLFPAWSAFDNLALAVRQLDQQCPPTEAALADMLVAEATRYGIPAAWLAESISRRSRQQRAVIALWRALRARPRLILFDGLALDPGQLGDEMDIGLLLADALSADPAIVVATENAADIPLRPAPGRALHAHMHQGRLEWAATHLSIF